MNEKDITYLIENFGYTKNEINKLENLLNLFNDYIPFKQYLIATKQEKYFTLRLKYYYSTSLFIIELQDEYNKTIELTTRELFKMNNINSFNNNVNKILIYTDKINR